MIIKWRRVKKQYQRVSCTRYFFYESLSLTLFPQVTETRALIEKHYYRIDVIQKVLAKKAMEEEER